MMRTCFYAGASNAMLLLQEGNGPALLMDLAGFAEDVAQ